MAHQAPVPNVVPIRRWRGHLSAHGRLNHPPSTLPTRRYFARHSSVSWNLMVQPEKLLWIAEQHGHSVAVMLKDYAAWTKGAKDSDVAVIRAAMQAAPGQLLKAA